MPGVKNRSGGWNRRSAADHLVAGTYRQDRHGPVTVAPLIPGEQLVLWLKRAALLDELGFGLLDRSMRTKRGRATIFAAGLKTLAAAEKLWMRIERAGGLRPQASPRPVDPLSAHLASRPPVPPSLDDHRRQGPRASGVSGNTDDQER